MPAQEEDAAWEGITAAVAKVGVPEAEGLRLHLRIEAHEATQGSILAWLRSMAYCFVRALQPSRANVFEIAEGSFLFCMPFDGGANLNNLLPVARLAAARGLLSGIVYDRVERGLLEREFPKTPLLSSKELWVSVSVGRRLAGLFRGVSCTWKLARALDAALPEVRRGVLRNPWRWAHEVSAAATYREAFRKLFRRCRPCFLLSTSDYFPFDSQFFEAGRLLGIPGAVVQHGVMGAHDWPFTAEYRFLWGVGACDELAAMGAPRGRLVATGMVASDRLFARAARDGAGPADGHLPRVLFISQAHASSQLPELYQRLSEILTKIVEATPAVRWAVKLHPAEDGSFYRGLPGATSERLEILPGGTRLEDALIGADIVCTMYSAAGLEAIIAGKPLFVLDIHPMVSRYGWWPSFGGGVFCRTEAEVFAEIQALTGDEIYRARRMERQEKFVAGYFANRGRAAVAVLDAALERSSGGGAPAGRDRQPGEGP